MAAASKPRKAVPIQSHGAPSVWLVLLTLRAALALYVGRLVEVRLDHELQVSARADPHSAGSEATQLTQKGCSFVLAASGLGLQRLAWFSRNGRRALGRTLVAGGWVH